MGGLVFVTVRCERCEGLGYGKWEMGTTTTTLEVKDEHLVMETHEQTWPGTRIED